jgi:hypothetical protein
LDEEDLKRAIVVVLLTDGSDTALGVVMLLFGDNGRERRGKTILFILNQTK